MRVPDPSAASFEQLCRMLRANGVTRLFRKQLAPNDNSKNQIYLGGDFSVVNVLPSGELTRENSSSGKRPAQGRKRLKASLPFAWIDAAGGVHPAPNAQIILYPDDGFHGKQIDDSSARGRP